LPKDDSTALKAQLDDSSVVGAVLSGDGKSYDILVRRYQKLVYNMLFQMVHSHEMAADLTQETFLKAYRALGTFRREAKFKPWLLRIATNSCLNAIRDSKDHDSLDAIVEENPLAEPVGTIDVEAEVEWRISQQMLVEALSQLKLRHRQIFVLRYQHDLSYEEIAEVSGESISTVKSLLFRIREKLRTILQEKMSDKVQ
jgi:RNA polymerase sigma-70 factor (ECF subfamily)